MVWNPLKSPEICSISWNPLDHISFRARNHRRLVVITPPLRASLPWWGWLIAHFPQWHTDGEMPELFLGNQVIIALINRSLFCTILSTSRHVSLITTTSEIGLPPYRKRECFPQLPIFSHKCILDMKLWFRSGMVSLFLWTEWKVRKVFLEGLTNTGVRHDMSSSWHHDTPP